MSSVDLVPVGFNEKHADLKGEFVRRLTGLLQFEEIKMSSYAISEDYLGQPCEQVKLEVPGFVLSLQMTRTK